MIELLRPAITRRETSDGFILESLTPLPAPAATVGVWLDRWAREIPERVFLAERVGSEWRTLTYGDAFTKVRVYAGALLARGLTPTRPLLVLSDNSIDVGLLQLACMHAGVPVALVSPAYALAAGARLHDMIEQVGPGLAYADDPVRYAKALAMAGQSVTVAELDGPPIEARGGPDTIAKLLFTSGSTGRPKGVVNTQRMLTSNQESLLACWPYLGARPPVLVDWLPWSHTFGSNHNFFLALRTGGALYIDRGRPVPGLIETTLANMADVGPTVWVNVPRGFDQAVPLLEANPALAARVLRNIDVVFYGAAALRPSTRERLQALAVKAERDIFFTSGWGSTETSPLATSTHYVSDVPGILGVPVPGVALKLARVGDLYELRVRGPNVTPGTWRAGGTVEPIALDEDGFLPMGDAGRLANETRPEEGVVFGGRIGENFKLSSGTWVRVGAVRVALVDALTPFVIDAVIAGHDHDELCALLFASPSTLALPDLDAQLHVALARYNEGRSLSERIARVLVLSEPPSLDEGETTDKGYINQRRVLERRAAHVTTLLAATTTIVRA